MIGSAELLRRCHQAVPTQVDDPTSPDSLIGFFQHFRPDGDGLTGLFDGLPGGADVHRRLNRLFRIAGNDRRGDGRRDAYFIVRRPERLEADEVEQLGENWLSGLAAIAAASNDLVLTGVIDPRPRIRVLEGKPPKHPKDPINQCDLLKGFLERIPGLSRNLPVSHDLAELLRPAFYFTSCDHLLCDYLMWPLYQNSFVDSDHRDDPSLADPLLPYFQLWRHGIKYRIIRDNTVDLYIPRPEVKTPLLVQGDAI